MAEEVIGLLFGVEGVGVNGASGQEIVKGLTQIVNEINSGKSTVPKIKFHFDTTEATKAVDDLKAKLKDIEKTASIKVTYSNGKGGKGGSGSLTQELKKEMSEALALQRKISGTKVTLGKLELEGGNANQIAEYTSQLERLEEQYSQLMQTFMKKVNGNAGDIMFDDIKSFSDQYANLGQIADDTLAVARAKDVDTKAAAAQSQKYDDLSTKIKKWIQASKQGAKLAEEYSTITRQGDGTLVGSAEGYDKTIAAINQTNEVMKELRITFDEGGEPIKPNEEDFAKTAAAIGLTKEQYESLFERVKAGSDVAAQNVQNANRKNQQSWTATASKIRDEVQRMYDTIAKDPNARRMADEIIEYSKSAKGSVGDLKNKYDELRNAIHESGADIETWGDKFKKTFAGKVRSALAAAVTAVLTKYLREIYQNVVNIDKALVNLQIASGKTRTETKALIKEYATLAQKLGATTTEVAEAADTWLRQGYSTEEANTLITNSMMLSKLGQMESAEASKALTSAMKGYGVAVEDSVQIVDKLTKVDMEAAASAGDIATAMAETATSAKLSGVSMDALIGYITTVKEVTQDGSESVGVFFKTLFARMNNVAAGKFVDDETGESLNDVEAVLGNLGIALRGVNGEFRNSSDVLDDVAARWDTFNDTERNAIATAMAGTRNFEKFNVLMSNYGTAMDYATVATESGGTAVEKFGAYTEGVEGKMNALKAAFEKFSVAFLDSDLVAAVFEFFTLIMNGIAGVTSFIDSIGGLPTVLLAVASALLLVNGGLIAYNTQIKITAAYQAILLFFTKLKTGLMSIVHAIPNAIVAWRAYAAGTVSASTAMQASIPVIGLVLVAVTALVGALSIYNGKVDESRQEALAAADAAADASDEIYKLTQEYISLSDAVVDDISVKDKLITCEDTLIKKLGVEKAEIQDLIDKYGSYEDAVKAAAVAKLQDEERELRSNYHTFAEDLVDKQGEKSIGLANLYGTMGVKVEDDEEAITESAINAINALISTGKVTSYSANFVEGNVWRGKSLFNILWSGDGVSPDSPEDILAAFEDIKVMLDYVQNTVGDNNPVYDQLLTIYNSAKKDVEGYSNSIVALNSNLAEQYVVTGLIGREMPKTQSDFDAYRQSVIDSATASGEFVGTQDDIARAIDSILKQNDDFTEFYTVPTECTKSVTVALKTINDVVDETQEGFDGLVSAMSDVTSEGYLTADALTSLAKLEKENALGGLTLADILMQDANGYKLASNALEQYITKVIEAVKAQYAGITAFATEQDKQNALDNINTYIGVLTALIATTEDSADASKAQREALEAEQEMYENQRDAFEELIDIRKELLQTYADEVSYQRELEKKQRAVSSLQQKLSVARLDSSAAGQARVRELEAELQEAQDDLDDFALEHAIDVLTAQLEAESVENEAFFQQHLDRIEGLLAELDTSPEVNVNIDTSWASTLLTGLNEVKTALGRLGVNDGGSETGTGGSGGRGGRSRKDMFTVSVYHSGGLVGDIATPSSGEEFAKLLKGEFVSTPAQMKRFMEDTLPKIANYSATGGTNEFNAPLIEITCESVTTEALPELERVVNEAVKEIKKQLDSGMSRTGFKRTPIKRLT